MTGLERNADVVRMASYAPLFANTEAWQWTPDLLWVDSLRVYPTPNYYVQQLFGRNRGDEVLPTEVGGIETSAKGRQSLYASATHDDDSNDTIIKVVNPEENCRGRRILLAGLSGCRQGAGRSSWPVISRMRSGDPIGAAQESFHRSNLLSTMRPPIFRTRSRRIQ